jgi:type III pantothenate kinase
MILLVDAGNTRIKWRVVGVYADACRTLHAMGVVATGDWAELAAAWQPFALNRAVLSCVADAAVQAGLAQILAARGTSAHWLAAEREKYGVFNHYRVPEQLGADRYAALIAVARLKLGDCVVASVGTATTIDQLDRMGAFLGGVILPGPDMMRAALLGGTGQIERRMPAQAGLATDWNLAPPPRDTAAAVTTGIGLAQAAAINAMLAAMFQTMKQGTSEPAAGSPLLILTGGAREQVRAGLCCELIEMDDLVLDGLAWIALEPNCEN